MIEQILEGLIKELGATGVLVIGLYAMLYRPLKSMSCHLGKINEELGELITMLKKEIKEENG